MTDIAAHSLPLHSETTLGIVESGTLMPKNPSFHSVHIGEFLFNRGMIAGWPGWHRFLGQTLSAFSLVLALFLASPALAQSANGNILAGPFSQGLLSEWRSRSFKGNTKYEIVKDPDSGAQVLAASAAGTASGRYREIKIDLTKTPFLNWSWKVAGIFPGIDESVKSGDDFPARIYVVVERGLLGARSLALNYVWASQHSLGSEWSSPYTDQVHLVATDSGQQGLGAWVNHKRNLRDDLKRAFGEEITKIDAVAIMTDADDHKGRATAYYGDIWFSPE